MWTEGLLSMEHAKPGLSVFMHVVFLDSEVKATIWRARISGHQAREISQIVLSGNCQCDSAVGLMDWLKVDLGISFEKTTHYRERGFRHCDYSTLIGVFIHGRNWSLNDYSQHGQLCETVFGDLHTVSLGWMAAETEAPFSLIFCY